MATIYKTKNFIVESHKKPEIDRLEGGHIKISSIKKRSNREELSTQEAIELMRLTIVCGKAMKIGMKKQGIQIGKINYQENGNWSPGLHIHLYCRSIDAKIQKFGDPITPGHQEYFDPLNVEDIKVVKEEIEILFLRADFSNERWGLLSTV